MELALAQIRIERVARYYNPDHDIAGIAGPIFGADGEILGCIGVTMPSKRFQLHLEDDLATAVRETAEQLSAQARTSIV
jgi:DNA-binding IclR family transcriptional regulator